MKNTAMKNTAAIVLAAIERANKLNSHGIEAARAERAMLAGRNARAVKYAARVPAA